MKHTAIACLALSLAAGCDLTQPKAKHSTTGVSRGPVDVRMVPTYADLHVGDRVSFVASDPWVGPRWSWTVTDSNVARIHPDSGIVLALRPGDTNVIATSRDDPRVRGVAPVRVR